MTDRTNAERRADALETVRRYCEITEQDYNADSLDAWVSDLLTDLFHLARAEDFSLEDRFAMAHTNYRAELAEEET